ncbi:MAG: hypothetical protein OSA89_19835 [Mariniblastus sp.]|nr:hypothetical protein [Mariniblastus sp.]
MSFARAPLQCILLPVHTDSPSGPRNSDNKPNGTFDIRFSAKCIFYFVSKRLCKTSPKTNHGVSIADVIHGMPAEMSDSSPRYLVRILPIAMPNV